jgi:tripartite ATP-independent transporter DctM subunit
MVWGTSLSLLVGPLFFLMFLGVPVAVAFFLIDFMGAYTFLGGERGFVTVIRGTLSSLANINLAAIPLFLLMGEILFQTELAFRAIDAIDRLITRVPGRLSVVAITGGTIFSALSGSTVATTALLGKSLLPEMLRRGYKPEMAMGPIIGIGGVDMLIPPSALTVLLATLASAVSRDKLSVTDLLIAGIIPGLIMSVLFVVYIVTTCWLRPAYSPRSTVKRTPLAERWKPFVVHVLPLFALFIVVMGSMVGGIASPTDAAALGCIAAALLAAIYRKLTLKALTMSLMQTAIVTAMVFFILAGSTTFSQLLAFSGAVDGALDLLKQFELTPLRAVMLMIAVLIVLGCVLDQISMMLLTFPFFMPMANALQLDLVWLGIVLLISLQIGLLTPPFGILLFVMRGVVPPEISMRQIWAAAMPYAVMTFLVLVAVVLVPEIATYLPGILR